MLMLYIPEYYELHLTKKIYTSSQNSGPRESRLYNNVLINRTFGTKPNARLSKVSQYVPLCAPLRQASSSLHNLG